MPDPPSRLAAFIAELRRRRVFRVAVVYAGVAFILVQIVDGTFDPMGIPIWVSRLIILLLALGFPIAVGLAWAFDLTEEGLVRAKPKREPTAAKAPHHPLVGNKSLAVIAALAIIVAAWSWWGWPGPEAVLGEKSIAVLPFVNFSDSKDDEGNLTDILSRQKTVARAMAPQVNPEAYNLYLKGWAFRRQETSESMHKALEYLEQAVALEPGFALAWAALAHSYFLMTMYGGWDDIYGHNRMKEALDKALGLDPNLPDAHAGLGVYRELAQYDFAGAEASFRRALELDPDLVYAHFEYGMFLWRTGRPDEGLVELQRAHELDPLSPQPLGGIAYIYSYTRQYKKAQEYWQAVLELAPDQKNTRFVLPWAKREVLMQQGRYAEVAPAAEKAYADTAERWGKAEELFQQLRAEWARGNREKVYSVHDSLRSTREPQQWEQEDPFWSARYYAIIGERDKALGLLERAYEDTAIFRPSLVYNSEFDPLRDEPRFKAIIQKMGLTEVFDQNGQRIR